MTEKQQTILGGIIAIILSWVFTRCAVRVTSDGLMVWYGIASTCFGIGGLFAIAIGVIEM